MRMTRRTGVAAALAVAGLFAATALLGTGCDRGTPSGGGTAGGGGGGGESGGRRVRVAYVTNGPDPFWDIAAKGAKDGAAKFNADLQVIFPSDAGDQKQKIEDLLVRGVDGIAISPIDATNQTQSINDWAKKTKIITQDSDAPKSDRLMYIGVDNYQAGRMCGQLVKEAIPDGGKVAIFVGRLEQDNARLRRQGVVDELLGRQRDDNRQENPSDVQKGDKYTVLGTWTDNFDPQRAKGNVEDVISVNPDIACVVGLFAYNPPLCLQALRSQNKLGTVKVVGFDEQNDTLQAIKDGNCQGTVVQNPYMYGHESVRVLAGIIRGDQSVVPANKYMDIPPRQIRKDNVDEFWAELKKNLGQ